MILILTDVSRDYGADYLAHGLCAAFGERNVVECPRKASLHWTEPPIFDCDVNLNTREMSESQIHEWLNMGKFDLVVIPTLRGVVPQMLMRWRDLLRRNADRVAFCDMEDHANNMEPAVRELLGFRPAAFFKRELPIGETWARPFPFGYPAERIRPVDVTSDRPRGVVYAAHVWDWATGKLRDRLGPELLRAFNGRADVLATRGDDQRRSISDYHAANRRALVAISPAGQGYHTNRHLEIIADGCCPLYERPWRQWPDAPQEGAHCVYFRDELEAVDAARELMNDHAAAIEMAQAAQAWLLDGHTTAHRAREVWGAVHDG